MIFMVIMTCFLPSKGPQTHLAPGRGQKNYDDDHDNDDNDDDKNDDDHADKLFKSIIYVGLLQ